LATINQDFYAKAHLNYVISLRNKQQTENNINYRRLKKLYVVYKSSFQFTELQFNFCPKKPLKINKFYQVIFLQNRFSKAKIISD